MSKSTDSEFKVGDKVLLQGKVIEYVEPRNRGVGVAIHVGRVELPIWANAADLLHQESLTVLITEDEFQEAFNRICGETPEDVSESDTKRLVDWINTHAPAPSHIGTQAAYDRGFNAGVAASKKLRNTTEPPKGLEFLALGESNTPKLEMQYGENITEKFQRGKLVEMLAQLPTRQQELFGRMYPKGIKREDLTWAITQCHNTIVKNEAVAAGAHTREEGT